jgi:SpoVK/Ycf46/Vps4 family AAA+-type ATPase
MELTVIKLIMNLVDKILGQLPDKEEREKNRKKKSIEEFNDLKNKYLLEINKPDEIRDADLILNIRDAIMLKASEVVK